jgi:nucleotide-binding universal stress UspA family protein
MDRSRFRPWIATVVVGADGESDDGRIALAWAARLAEAFSARLIVVDVWESPAEFSGPIPFRSREQDERLQRVLGLLGATELEVELVPAVGDPGKALLVAADDYNADLIVIGNHHDGRLHRLLHEGGTRGRLLRDGVKSVLIANADGRHRAPRPKRRAN